MESHLFWFTAEQWGEDRAAPADEPTGAQRHDDRRILSGIMHVLKIGFR